MIDRLEAGHLSSCWGLSEAERSSAAAATRRWARERYGSLDEPRPLEATIRWRAYSAPGGS